MIVCDIPARSTDIERDAVETNLTLSATFRIRAADRNQSLARIGSSHDEAG
jgi:hypothetical protein